MQVWKGIGSNTAPFKGGSLIMGNFDGLHLGHQKLLAEARQRGQPVVVMTFDPHPVQVLYPERRLARIFPREDLVEQLPRHGADLLVILEFNRALAQTKAQDFWRDTVLGPFAPKNMIAGADFAFGQSREGSLEELRGWCGSAGCALHVVQPQLMEGEVVSSRGIREHIKSGEVDKAMRKLGRPFYLRGRVGDGAGRGQGLGSPTLNLEVINETQPPHGVYATLTRHGGERLLSVTNIGVNPTFQSSGSIETTPTKVETHIIGRTFEARGEWVDVDFIERLRPEMKFPSIEDLKKQIQSDILKAKVIVERYEALDIHQRQQ